eukprot:TRINITY_DN910_c0_g1_i3.p2 TRINITY_DN910_c0_g1~~TRINITY_DN910_c0_g1_i3.p2  ORF type:complete len:162 (+),score=12.05 TRINITY_DN910_c0_g1_i3:493-978(+)
MQATWKLWPHMGKIRNVSFSSYSPKHIEHWASSLELKASLLNFTVGNADTTTGAKPLTCSLISRSDLISAPNVSVDSGGDRILPQMSLMQTKMIKVALIPNPITVVIKFISPGMPTKQPQILTTQNICNNNNSIIVKSEKPNWNSNGFGSREVWMRIELLI